LDRPPSHAAPATAFRHWTRPRAGRSMAPHHSVLVRFYRRTPPGRARVRVMPLMAWRRNPSAGRAVVAARGAASTPFGISRGFPGDVEPADQVSDGHGPWDLALSRCRMARAARCTTMPPGSLLPSSTWPYATRPGLVADAASLSRRLPHMRKLPEAAVRRGRSGWSRSALPTPCPGRSRPVRRSQPVWLPAGPRRPGPQTAQSRSDSPTATGP
jgi:hypothetical protein